MIVSDPVIYVHVPLMTKCVFEFLLVHVKCLKTLNNSDSGCNSHALGCVGSIKRSQTAVL